MTSAPSVPAVLNRAQYCLLRSLGKVGLPAELLQIFLGRCGATESDWQCLVATQLVEVGRHSTRGRYMLTTLGKRTYNKRPKNLYF